MASAQRGVTRGADRRCGERANRLAARAPATKTPRRARRRAGAFDHRARASTRERARSLEARDDDATTTDRWIRR